MADATVWQLAKFCGSKILWISSDLKPFFVYSFICLVKSLISVSTARYLRLLVSRSQSASQTSDISKVNFLVPDSLL